MKTSRLHPVWLIGVFVLASLGSALGQGCFNWMIPKYSTYATHSTDGTRIYTSVLVDGTTGGSCSQSGGCDHCNQIMTPTPVHTPRAYNKLGSTGGWSIGAAHSWNEYITEENDQNIVATHGVNYTFNASTNVLCSVAGCFSCITNPIVTLRIADTDYIFNGTSLDTCEYLLYCPNGNTAATCGGGHDRTLYTGLRGILRMSELSSHSRPGGKWSMPLCRERRLCKHSDQLQLEDV
jgi:hypothetical protein